MIHLPHTFDEYASLSVDFLRGLVDLFSQYLPIEKEEWTPYISGSHTLRSFVWESRLARQGFLQRKPFFSSQCYRVQLTAYCRLFAAKCAEINATTTINPAQDHLLGGMVENEVTVHGTIDRIIWENIPQEQFLNYFKKACQNLKATYALIEEHRWGVLYTIAAGWFMRHAKEGELIDLSTVDAESRLPGIHWAQFITSSFVQQTGSLEYIRQNAPAEIMEKLGDGLWVQTTKELSECLPENRLELCRFFSGSLYPFDLKKEFDMRVQRGWTEVSMDMLHKAPKDYLEYIPLEKDEIALVRKFERERSAFPMTPIRRSGSKQSKS